LRGLSAEALQRVVDGVAPGGRVLRYRPLRGGISASVYQLDLEASNGARQAVVVRRYAAEWHRADPDVCAREFRVLAELQRWAFPAPRPLLLEQEGGPFGAPTIVTTRLPGRPVLRTRDIQDYVRQIATTLVQLHSVPIDRLDFLPDQAALLSNSLANHEVADDPLEPALRQSVLSAWPTVSATPTRRALVHGDYWPGNLLWRRGRLVGVVDWEDARVGDPSRDVAICRGDLTLLFGQDAANAFLGHYEAVADRRVSDLPFWDLLTCTLALPEVDHWSPGWRALGRSDMTVESARERFRDLARAALASSAQAAPEAAAGPKRGTIAVRMPAGDPQCRSCSSSASLP
jgi:aminoglycoside phosphotransferase (APT) family kinase protein